MSVAYAGGVQGRAPPPDPATFHGFIDTAEDAMIVVEATRLGVLERITRRPQHRESQYLRSGAVFVYDENEAGMKRWTDKLMWSPSRQVGHFFVYRQMTVKVPRGTRMQDIAELAGTTGDSTSFEPDSYMANEEKKYVGSLTSSSVYLREGLVKKTLALGSVHVISYFTLDDAMYGRLSTPSQIPELSAIAIPPGLRSLLPAASSRPFYASQDSDHGPVASASRPDSHRALTSPQAFDQQPISSYYEPDFTSQGRGRAYSLPDLQVPGFSSPSPPFRPSTSYASPVPPSPLYPSPLSPLRLQPVPQSLEDAQAGRLPDTAYASYAAPGPSQYASHQRSRAQTSQPRRLLHAVPEPIQIPVNPGQQGVWGSNQYQGPSSAPIYHPAPIDTAYASEARGSYLQQSSSHVLPYTGYQPPHQPSQYDDWSSPTSSSFDGPSPGPLSPMSLGSSPAGQEWPQYTNQQNAWHQQQQLQGQTWNNQGGSSRR